MNSRLNLTAAAVLLAGLAPMNADAVIAVTAQDTYVCTTAPDTPLGKPTEPSYTQLAMGPDCGTQMQFKIPSGISAANVSKATLYFFITSLQAFGTLKFFEINTASWDEWALTNSNIAFSLGTLKDSPDDIVLSNKISRDGQWYSLDVTNTFKYWISNPTLNLGINIISQPGSGAIAYLGSKENLQTSHAAYIDVLLNPTPGVALSSKNTAPPAGYTITTNPVYFPPFGNINGGSTQSEANTQLMMPTGCTMNTLTVKTGYVGNPVNSFSYAGKTVNLRVNGADNTTLFCTIAAGAGPGGAEGCSATTASVNIAAGDLVNWKINSVPTIDQRLTTAIWVGSSCNTLQ